MIAKEKRGAYIEEGESLGCLLHPFTGEVLREIKASRSGVMIHGGAAWPVVPERYPLAMLGDLVEEAAERVE